MPSRPSITPATPSSALPGRKFRSGGPGRAGLHPTFGPDQEPPPQNLLTTVGRVLRTRKLWVLQGLVLVPLVVAVLTLRQEEQYTATAALFFRDSAGAVLEELGGGTFDDPTRDAATNDDLITLPTVARVAAQKLRQRPDVGQVSQQTVAQSVTVTPSDQSDLVEIEVEHPDPFLAAAVANDYGEAYIEFRRTVDRGQLQEAIRLVEGRLSMLPPEQRTGDIGGALAAQLEDLRLAEALQTGKAELVQRAGVPEEPSSPDLQRNLVLGLMLGAVLGLGAGILRDRVDHSVRSVEEIEELYDLPVLARIPRSREFRRGARRIETQHVQEAEAFRTLRANLGFLGVDGPLRSLLIASPVSGDGKSTVAWGLARTMAAMGDRVVLVEADLHKGPSPGADDAALGLSLVLSGTALDDAFVYESVGDEGTGVSGRKLVILPSGPTPPNPLELLESDRMADVLSTLEESFDHVLIDTPALTVLSDARPLAAEVSGVVVVLGLEHTSRAAAIDCRKQLELIRANALGLVVNLVPAQRVGYYQAY